MERSSVYHQKYSWQESDEAYESSEPPLSDREARTRILQSHIQTSDDRPTAELSRCLLRIEMSPNVAGRRRRRSSAGSNDEDAFSNIPMPTISTNITPFSYQRALGNRIPVSKLSRRQAYDTRKWTPIFLHDCLMLPGSLANILGKDSPEDIIQRTTPALLPGFRLHVHSQTQQPCLLQSPRPADYAPGMAIFGQGRAGLACIDEHYRAYARRVKVQVEIEIDVPVLGDRADVVGGGSHLERRHVWAYAWLWSNVGSVDVCPPSHQPSWNLEDYIAGNLGSEGNRRIEDDAEGDEWGNEDALVDCGDIDDESDESDPVGGAYGDLDYVRSNEFTGW